MNKREKAIKEFEGYLNEHGEEPNAVYCSVVFHEDDFEMETIIKLDCEYDEINDDRFFFYCHHINNFIALIGKESNIEDFYVSDVYEFINTKDYEHI